jgi:hypothetical protein
LAVVRGHQHAPPDFERAAQLVATMRHRFLQLDILLDDVRTEFDPMMSSIRLQARSRPAFLHPGR